MVMEWVKTDSSIRQIPRQADALELGIVRPFDDLVIGQCIKYQRRNILSASKINRNNRRTVCAVSEKKNFKIRTSAYLYTPHFCRLTEEYVSISISMLFIMPHI